MRAFAFAFALTLFAPPAFADGLNGRWVGWYICGQGLTGLALTISGDDDSASTDEIEAHFSFYAVNSNPEVPSGAFAMRGTRSGDSIVLRGAEWIERPEGYEVVDLHGAFHGEEAPGELIRGAVHFAIAPELCTEFEVRRASTPIS